MLPVYGRLRAAGRSLPDGLEYVDSWVEANFSRCFQLMRCDDLRLIQQWILQWRGAGVTFEIVPVVASKETSGRRRAFSRSRARNRSGISSAELITSRIACIHRASYQ